MEFSEYAAKFSPEAKKSRKKLPPELLSALDQIQDELLEDPDKNPDRVTPIELHGDTFVYVDPESRIQITYAVNTDKKIIYFFHYVVPSLEVQKSVFISYSHEDEPWLNKVKKYLSVLEQKGVLEFWDDTRLQSGKPWHEKILEALESAQACVLLVSQNFVNSDFINNEELPKLLEGAKKEGKKLFWIHLSSSTVFESLSEITKFQSLQKHPRKSLEELSDVEQKKALVEISNKLSEAVTLH